MLEVITSFVLMPQDFLLWGIVLGGALTSLFFWSVSKTRKWGTDAERTSKGAFIYSIIFLVVVTVMILIYTFGL